MSSPTLALEVLAEWTMVAHLLCPFNMNQQCVNVNGFCPWSYGTRQRPGLASKAREQKMINRLQHRPNQSNYQHTEQHKVKLTSARSDAPLGHQFCICAYTPQYLCPHVERCTMDGLATSHCDHVSLLCCVCGGGAVLLLMIAIKHTLPKSRALLLCAFK